MIEIVADFHDHIWTDPRNPEETAKLAFSLDDVVDAITDAGFDAFSVTDIMANWPGESEFKEHRYDCLLNTSRTNGKYDFDKRRGYSVIYGKNGKPALYLIRTQEVLAEHFRHILVVGVDEDIPGGRSPEDVAKHARNLGGYCIIDHPALKRVWSLGEIDDLYNADLIQALEINMKLSWPSKGLPGFIAYNLPTKKCNKWVLDIERKTSIPAVVNNDLSDPDDLLEETLGSTIYYVDSTVEDLVNGKLIDGVFKAIEKGVKRTRLDNHGGFIREIRYSRWRAPLAHVKYGKLSQKRGGKFGVNRGLPDP